MIFTPAKIIQMRFILSFFRSINLIKINLINRNAFEILS